MNQEKNSIDDLFRSGLDGYQKEPSEGVWRNVKKAFLGNSSGYDNLIRGIAALFILLGIGSQMILLSPSRDFQDEAHQKVNPINQTSPGKISQYQPSPSYGSFDQDTPESSSIETSIIEEKETDPNFQPHPPVKESVTSRIMSEDLFVSSSLMSSGASSVHIITPVYYMKSLWPGAYFSNFPVRHDQRDEFQELTPLHISK